MSRFFLLAPMVVFGLIGLVLLWMLYATEGGGVFHDSLLPELIGFSLEGFILVGLLTLVQRSRESARRKELLLSLRGSFRSLLSLLDVAFLEPDAEPASSRQLETEPQLVDRMLARLEASHPDIDSLVALKREADETLSLARDLVAVAAQLSATHMNWWIAIVDSIRRVSEARDRDALEAYLHEMLINIREFDRLET
ncbi:hypothetical protein [Halomonas denitrificans]|nr:hypothetical protein [Halomonas denitrificans]